MTMAKTIKMNKTKRKNDLSPKAAKILQTVALVSNSFLWRLLEILSIAVIVSTAVLFTGSGLIPFLGYSIASAIELTQSTPLYTALVDWGFPMLFFIIIIAVAEFSILGLVIRKLNNVFSGFIEKGRAKVFKTDEEQK